jgi:hypothetical protein
MSPKNRRALLKAIKQKSTPAFRKEMSDKLLANVRDDELVKQRERYFSAMFERMFETEH